MKRAVVIGGSIAGLSAAQVLSSVVDEVVILEKDSLDERLSARKGAPQGRHVHALLIGGQLALEDIFPGFSEQAMAQGALRANMGNEVAWQIFGGFRPHYTSALHPLAASRPLIERELRHCALKNPKLRLRMGVEVQGYLEKDGEIQGVLLEEGEQEERLEAQIVVDCSGRASKTPAFLAALGYPGPEEEVVTSKAGYATRLYRLREDPSRSWKMMYLQPSPRTGKRGGILAPIEGGLHFCTLLGMAGDVPPTDEAGYMAFARSLSAPYLAEVLEAAEAIGPIHSFQRAENRWKHYEKLPKYLEGLLVMGDATFAPNPVYGQGMSAAALGAKALQAVLARHGTGRGLSRKFQAELATVVTLPWQMATGEDRRWPIAENQGTMPMGQKMLGWWVDRVQEATLHSSTVAEAFYRVAQLVDPPTALFAPALVWEVARLSFQRPQLRTQPGGGPAEASPRALTTKVAGSF